MATAAKLRTEMANLVSSNAKKISPIFERILAMFPQEINFAFAYGSGVFEQGENQAKEANMIDLIFAVDNPVHFHRLNMETNRRHYSFLKYGGPDLISKIQQNLGARVYYNTLIPFENRTIKYGVVSSSALVTDLLDWDTLYLSGRLHKPVLVLKKPSDFSKSILKTALKMNLNNAIHSAFLLLPETFTEEELYLKIAGLSYAGDFRMWAGEDKNKIKNIVKGSYPHFQELYHDCIATLPHIYWRKDSGLIEQDLCPTSRLHHLNLLPTTVLDNLYKFGNKSGRHIDDIEDVLKVIAKNWYCDECVQEAIERIVWASSWTQSFKGVFTAGKQKVAAIN